MLEFDIEWPVVFMHANRNKDTDTVFRLEGAYTELYCYIYLISLDCATISDESGLHVIPLLVNVHK